VWFQRLNNSKDEKSVWVRTGRSIVNIDSTFSIVKRAEKMKPSINYLLAAKFDPLPEGNERTK
jgi:hypothetical protein